MKIRAFEMAEELTKSQTAGFRSAMKKYTDTLRSTTNKEHTRISGSEGYSFCEPVTAAVGHWHIRKLDSTGKHTSGGITTASLCNHVRPLSEGGCGGWDLVVDITPHHGEHNCKQCFRIMIGQITNET